MKPTQHHTPGTAATAPWTPPPGPDARAVPVGVQWDAVRVPAHLAVPTIDALGPLCGSVLGDPYGSRYYWLIPPDAADDWNGLPTAAEVQHLSVACWLTVPPAYRSWPPGPHWVVPYRKDSYLTDPYRLHTALTHTTATACGPGKAATS